MIRSFRAAVAAQNLVSGNLLIRTWGGLGDQICAEPTLRYTLDAFAGENCRVSLASEHPYLFQHLNFHEVYNLKLVQPDYDKFLLFDTIVSPQHLTWEFVNHMLTNCVDFPSLCAFGCQLPIKYKHVQLHPTQNDIEKIWGYFPETENYVAIHAGKHWHSKTFPKWWWDEVIDEILQAGKIPVLFGANTDDNRSTVDVNTNGCIDMRNRLTIMESVAALQRIKVLLTNDSAPLHMAASGDSWIGFVATCKHPDMITHWRKGGWSHKMKNFGKGGVWDIISHCPNRDPQGPEVSAERVPDDALLSWLPNTGEFAHWALSKLEEP